VHIAEVRQIIARLHALPKADDDRRCPDGLGPNTATGACRAPASGGHRSVQNAAGE